MLIKNLIFFATAQTWAEKCPDGWNEFQGHCYMIGTNFYENAKIRTWHNAKVKMVKIEKTQKKNTTVGALFERFFCKGLFLHGFWSFKKAKKGHLFGYFSTKRRNTCLFSFVLSNFLCL